MKVPLTPGQAVTVHGWWRPILWLTWVDVLADSHLTFGFLTATCRLSEATLHLLQPDIAAWVKAERVFLADCPRLGPWGAHPIRDLRADLADIIAMQWSAETLHRLGVTYEDLVGVGLQPGSMLFFNGVTLAGWAQLGFRRGHAEAMPPAALYRLFGLVRHDVLACLPA